MNSCVRSAINPLRTRTDKRLPTKYFAFSHLNWTNAMLLPRIDDESKILSAWMCVHAYAGVLTMPYTRYTLPFRHRNRCAHDTYCFSCDRNAISYWCFSCRRNMQTTSAGFSVQWPISMVRPVRCGNALSECERMQCAIVSCLLFDVLWNSTVDRNFEWNGVFGLSGNSIEMEKGWITAPIYFHID